MNLIQIQEHLKDMPTQAIMGYANGQNPMVPPYLALSEMNRRKQMEKRAAEPPQTSVKEQLEQELMQPQGITQGMPQQGMPPQMPPQGMPQGAPQGMRPPMPPQGAPQGAPQAPPQMAPQGMAGGGLTNLPVRSELFNYAPGGIVAFADEGLVKLPEQEAADIMAKQLKGDIDLPMPQTREDERAQYIQKNPEAAYLNKAPGEAMRGLMGTLKGQNEAQKQQFQERQSSQGLATLGNALMAAAEGTRGRKGSGAGEAFLGFGKTYAAAQAEDYKRQQEQAAIERAQTIEMAKLQSDVDNMQRAFDEGRIEDGMKYKAAVEARKGKIAELQGLRSKDVLTLADKQRDDIERARHNKEIEKLQAIQANAAAKSANKPSSFAEQWAAMVAHPELYAKFQGEKKSGTLTYEDAIRQVNSNNATKYLSPDKKAELAQDLVKQSAAVQAGKELPPVVKTPDDTRNPYERIMPEFMGGKPAPTAGTPQLPPGFIPVPVNK